MNTLLGFTFLYFNSILFCYGITEFRCTDKNTSDAQTVTLKCPPNSFINVKEALYGRNQWNECKYLVGDCVELFSVDTECCGRNDCTLVVRRIYSIKCSAYVSFFRVIYECESAELSTCSVKDDSLLPPEFEASRENVLPPTSPDVVIPTSDSEKIPRDVYIIVGSAATIAFLLTAIVTVLFFLRKYRWHNEKQCILELFIGLCKRHPPDGCEYPTEITSSSGRETSASDIQQIATLSSLVKPHSAYNKETTENQNTTQKNKNTFLCGIITEITQNRSQHVKKEVNIYLPTSEPRENGQVIDNIYAEIDDVRRVPDGEQNFQKVPSGNQTCYTDEHSAGDRNSNIPKVTIESEKVNVQTVPNGNKDHADSTAPDKQSNIEDNKNDSAEDGIFTDV